MRPCLEPCLEPCLVRVCHSVGSPPNFLDKGLPARHGLRGLLNPRRLHHRIPARLYSLAKTNACTERWWPPSRPPSCPWPWPWPLLLEKTGGLVSANHAANVLKRVCMYRPRVGLQWCVCVCGGSCTFQRSGTTLSFLEVRVVKHLLGGRALPAVAGQAAADQALGLCRDLRLGRENQLGVQDGLRRVGSRGKAAFCQRKGGALAVDSRVQKRRAARGNGDAGG